MKDKVAGHFYKEELVKAPNIEYLNHFFEVETILKQKRLKKKLFYYVKYMFYPDKFNEWIPAENMKTI